MKRARVIRQGGRITLIDGWPAWQQVEQADGKCWCLHAPSDHNDWYCYRCPCAIRREAAS